MSSLWLEKADLSLEIHRRIERRGGDIQSVIFERDQFASSLSNYRESRYRAKRYIVPFGDLPH